MPFLHSVHTVDQAESAKARLDKEHKAERRRRYASVHHEKMAVVRKHGRVPVEWEQRRVADDVQMRTRQSVEMGRAELRVKRALELSNAAMIHTPCPYSRCRAPAGTQCKGSSTGSHQSRIRAFLGEQ